MERVRYAGYRASPAGYKRLEDIVKIHRSKDWRAKLEQLNSKIVQFLGSAQSIIINGGQEN